MKQLIKIFVINEVIEILTPFLITFGILLALGFIFLIFCIVYKVITILKEKQNDKRRSNIL